MLDPFVNRVVGWCDEDAEFCHEAVDSPLAGIVRKSDGGSRTRAPVAQCSTRSLRSDMSKLLRGLAAGYGAKKLGGGCFSTVIIFLLLWWLLGHFQLFR
jgi:hypothetical protein